MTRAPANLMAVRQLLLSHLNIDESTVRDADLEPAEVGIVGDPNHRGGYHCGSDRVDGDDYSVRESSRDRNGLTLDAAALDVGKFRVTTRLGTFDLRHFSKWCVGQCEADAPDTRDIREIIYSPDGKTVKRWDRLKKRSGGDSSHLGHTHFSFFRDATKAGRDLTPLFRRYLAGIGLMTPGGSTIMFCQRGDESEVVRALQVRLTNLASALKDPKLDPGGKDGIYGDGTQAALKAACLKVNPRSAADGSKYNSDTMFYVDILIARAYGGGTSGPVPTVDIAALTKSVVTELTRRLAS